MVVVGYYSERVSKEAGEEEKEKGAEGEGGGKSLQYNIIIMARFSSQVEYLSS